MTPDEYPDNLDDLLDRFVAGECTPVEAEAVARWLDADPAPPKRHERLERFRRLWVATSQPKGGEVEPWDVDSAWRSATARISPAKVLVLTPPERKRRHWGVSIPAAARWAAAVALVVGSAALISTWVLPRTRSDRQAIATKAATAREYTTMRGERMMLTLVDGTRVVLGAASKLMVPLDYGRDAARVVTLEGEGYFDVVHDEARPFAVRAGRGLVRDIGTKFVVRAYTADQPVAVAVTQGEVLLADARLREGDLGHLDTTGAVRVRRGVDLRSYTSWIEGRLVFNDTPLTEAIPTLERWYDLEIVVADRALFDRRLFATLDNEPVSRVLDLIALSLNLQIDRQGRRVTLSKQSS